MQHKGLDETVSSLRRIATTGAVAATVLLVGAIVLMALSVLTSLARFTPYGLWGILGVLAAAALAGWLVWLRGPGTLRPLGGKRRGPALVTDVLRAPPSAPVRRLPAAVQPSASGRLGLETSVGLLVEQRRYEDALRRLDEIEGADPALATFCAVKRRAIARRQARGR